MGATAQRSQKTNDTTEGKRTNSEKQAQLDGRISPTMSVADRILRLQNIIGNRAVQRYVTDRRGNHIVGWHPGSHTGEAMDTSLQPVPTSEDVIQRDPQEVTVTEGPEEISVESIPPEYATRIVEWETQFNQMIQNRVGVRVNAYALVMVGAYRHYASWVRTHQPEDVEYSLFNGIVDTAVSAACAVLPGANVVLKAAVQVAIRAVRDAVKGAVRTGLASDTSWENAQTRLNTQGSNLILGLVQAPWARDFPGWLETNVPPEYQRVHRDYRDRMMSATAGGSAAGVTWRPSMIGGEVNRWLTALGVPDPQDRAVPRTLLARLIAETRLAQVRERATSALYLLLPGLATGEEGMFWNDPRELERRLGAEGLREAYRRLRRRGGSR